MHLLYVPRGCATNNVPEDVGVCVNLEGGGGIVDAAGAPLETGTDCDVGGCSGAGEP